MRRAVLLVALLSSCAHDRARPCSESSECIAGGVPGSCLPSPTSSTSWCAFPDDACTNGGWRWSPLAGDGLASACVDTVMDAGAADASSDPTLRVDVMGKGSGSIASAPQGISCPNTCEASFPSGSQITLAATPDTGSAFTSWAGACGPSACALELEADAQVTASFRDVFRWVNAEGDSEADVAVAMTVTADGDLLVGGNFSGQLNFGLGSLVSEAGSQDIFLVKYNQSGVPLWSERVGGAGNDSLTALGVDSTRSPVLAGTFDAPLSFGPSTIVPDPSGDAFLLTFAGPNPLRRLGGTGTEIVRDLVVDAADHIYVTGRVTADVDFGGQSVTTTDDKIFIARYSGTTLDWLSSFGGMGGDEATAIAFDESSTTVWVTGNFVSPMDFGGMPLDHAGGTDIFLFKLSNGGTPQVAWRFGSDGAERAHDLAIPMTGDVVLAGELEGGPVTFGGADLVPSERDGFVAVLSPAGVHRWSTLVNPSGDLALESVAAGDGYVYAAGTFFGILTSLGIHDAAGGDVVLLKWDLATGALNWVNRIGGPEHDSIADLVVTRMDGWVAFAGSHRGEVDFGNVTYTSDGAEDVFVGAFAP